MDAAMATLARPFPGGPGWPPQRQAAPVQQPPSQRNSQQSSDRAGSMHSASEADYDRMQQDVQGMRLQSDGPEAQDNSFQDSRRPSGQSERGPFMQPMPRGVTPGPYPGQHYGVQPAYQARPPSRGDVASLHSDPSQSSARSGHPQHRFSGSSSHSADAYGGVQEFEPVNEYYNGRPDDTAPHPAQQQPYDGAHYMHQGASVSQHPQDYHQAGLHVPAGQPMPPPQIMQPPPQQRPMQHMPGMPPMPFPGPGGPPSNGFPQQLGLPPGTMQRSLNRAMSSASSLNMMSYRSPMQSSSTTNLIPASTPAGSVMERKRTVSASTARDEPKAAITKAAIDEYRNRIKADPDPETQFLFAKYLIEAARKVGQTIANSPESDSKVKGYKRFRDSLLQESLKIMKKLATQGVGVGKPAYADAQFFYANLLSSGSLGLAVDAEKAYHLYVQASKQNHPAATYRTAYCNEAGVGTKRDFNRAVLFYRKASALGDPNGMFKLGMILLKGNLEQQRNGKEAVTWLNRAAQQADENNPQALHELAMLYENPPDPNSAVGPTVQPNEAVAADLYMQAARLGYAPSQNRLGQAFEFGHLGLPIEPRRSIAYYSRAAQRGYGHAELALSGWYLTGSPPELHQSDQEAFLWARKAANRGLPKAEYAVGYYYETGIGVKPDVEEAKRWYMRASAQNHKKAMARLTELKRSNQVKPGRKQGRPTRSDAQAECVVS